MNISRSPLNQGFSTREPHAARVHICDVLLCMMKNSYMMTYQKTCLVNVVSITIQYSSIPIAVSNCPAYRTRFIGEHLEGLHAMEDC
jgi:hypothetical protein